MELLAVLADPTRRRIVERLAEGEVSAGDLAADFSMSWPAVSRHLRVLREVGLVEARAEGTRRMYALRGEPLAELDAWLGRYRHVWAQRLDALETEVRRGRRAVPARPDSSRIRPRRDTA